MASVVFNTSFWRWRPCETHALLPLLLLGLVLAGCAATREGQVRSALVKAGVPEGYARCLAGEATPRLTNAQLRHIRDAALALQQAAPQHPGESLALLRQQLDPETITVVVGAALACTGRQWSMGRP